MLLLTIRFYMFTDISHKREVIGGDKSKETQQKMKKAAAKLSREIEKKSSLEVKDTVTTDSTGK